MAIDRTLVAIRPPQRPLRSDGLPNLRGMLPDELAQWVADNLGGPRFRSTQIFEWIHRHRATNFATMSNLGRRDRERLEQLATIDGLEVDTVLRSRDGTRKLRLRTADNALLESVLIPNEGRGYTLCISSMVGCSLTCRFCATASLGFVRNLAAWEIVDQVYRAQDLLHKEREGEWTPRIGSLVLMGMGEPLHNFNQVKTALGLLTSPQGAEIVGRRITVSTAGMVPAIERFAREGLANEVGLAVSLNATTDEIRDQVMPINTRWPIAELLAAVRDLPQPKRRRVTFEYVLLGGINDTDADAKRLVKLLGGFRSQVNVIPFNPHDAAPYRRPAPEVIERFVQQARRGGLRVHVRTPRGDDIGAACGQLALKGEA